MAKNEQITVNIVRKRLEAVGITIENGFLVDEQVVQNVLIKKLLPSKTEIGSGKGRPEFLISKTGDKDFLIVIECKADIKFHESPNQDQPANFAVDGVLLYASKLSHEFNVIAVAGSGQTKEELKISTFLFPKSSGTHSILTDTKKVPVSEIISWKDYIRFATYDETLAKSRKSDLNKFSRDLHDYIRDYGKITEAQKPLLVSGVLLALMKNAYKVSYKKLEGSDLARETFRAISDVIGDAKLGVNQENKKKAVINAFRFIEDHPELQKIDRKKNESPLAHIVHEINNEVRPFVQDHYDYDVIGNFYGEFIRYTGGDAQGLGIVLTPKHITELFVELAKLDKNDKVLDTCCGTGGFLISAMKKMTEGVSEKERLWILEHSLYGVEQEPQMFALAVSNMILRGDGKTNLYQGSCFDEEIFNQIKDKATAGFINPPYSQKGENLHEWNFVIQLLNALQKNATGIVIVPMSLAIDTEHPLRERLLKEHRLEATMSMPDDLFYPIGTNPCVMVFTAHVPHNSDKHHESWFGYWKDDGFRKVKKEGRIATDRWPEIKEEWLFSFTNKKIAPGLGIRRKVGHKDEWCCEAYMDIDFIKVPEQSFIETMREYVGILFSFGKLDNISKATFNNRGFNKEKKFERFKLIDEGKEKGLFNVEKGERLNKDKRIAGKIPLLTSTSFNNGVSNFIDKDVFLSDKKIFSDKITIDMLSNVFYHSYDYFSDDNVHTLIFKEKDQNIYVKMYLTTLLKQLKIKYAYGRQVRIKRLNEEYIYLPVNKKGNPDWQFMEDYIKSLPYSASI